MNQTGLGSREFCILPFGFGDARDLIALRFGAAHKKFRGLNGGRLGLRSSSGPWDVAQNEKRPVIVVFDRVKVGLMS